MEKNYAECKERFEKEYEIFDFRDHYFDWLGSVNRGIHKI